MSTGVKNANESLSRIVEDLSAKAIKGEDISATLLRLRDEVKNASENEDTVFAKFLRLLDSFRDILPEEKQRYNAAVTALSTTAKVDQKEIVQAISENLGKLKANIAKLRETLNSLEKDEQEIRSAMTAREKEAGVFGKEADRDKKTNGQFVPAAPAPRPATPVQPAPAVAVAPGDIFPDRIERKIIEQKVEVPAPLPVPPAPEASELTKKCAMCGKQMHFRASDKMWMCLVCGYAEARMIEIESTQIISGLIKDGLKSAPLSAPSAQDSAWQHRCPMCGGQMNFHGYEKIWLCYSCAYEEPQTGEAPAPCMAAPGRAEAPEPFRNSGPIDILHSFPVQAPAMSAGNEPITGSITVPVRPKTHHSSKKKPCPSCRKKMTWQEDERTWRCPYCEYERSI